MDLLGQSRFYSVRRETLTVYDADRYTILRYDAAPRNPLLGTWDVDSFETAPGTVSALVEGTTINVAFRIGTLGGFAGCNSFTGVYGTNGTVVRISKLALTRLACEPDVMDQETAFVAALEGAALIESRGTQLNLTDRNDALKVALLRPTPPEEASPAPAASPSAAPSKTPEATPTPTPKPTAKPTPAPTPTPTAPPTATPAPTAAPTTPPKPSAPPSTPPTASCTLTSPDAGPVATIVYPGGWATLTEPAELACRFFDPSPITVPADGSAPTAAITADSSSTAYVDAVQAATDPSTWTVSSSSAIQEGGIAVTCVSAVAKAETDGIPAGSARYACIADVGSSGTVRIQTVGAPDDEVFQSNAAIVSLMTLESTFTPGS
jgi:heat shock protein HslJ